MEQPDHQRGHFLTAEFEPRLLRGPGEVDHCSDWGHRAIPVKRGYGMAALGTPQEEKVHAIKDLEIVFENLEALPTDPMDDHISIDPGIPIPGEPLQEAMPFVAGYVAAKCHRFETILGRNVVQ